MAEEQNKLVKKFCSILKVRSYSLNSIKNYKSALLLFLNYFYQKDLINVSDVDIRKYLLFCARVKKYSTATLKQHMNFVKLFFATIYKKSLTLDFGKNLKKEYKLPKILSEDDVTRILQCISNIKHKLMIATIYSCGLMLQETIDLKISDVDIKKSIIKVAQSKKNNIREVILSQKLSSMLDNYYKVYKPKVWLFENSNGTQYSPRNVQAIFKRALRKANINKPASIKTLRHSFAVQESVIFFV